MTGVVADRPWCYHGLVKIRWDYCDIRPCEEGCDKGKFGHFHLSTLLKDDTATRTHLPVNCIFSALAKIISKGKIPATASG